MNILSIGCAWRGLDPRATLGIRLFISNGGRLHDAGFLVGNHLLVKIFDITVWLVHTILI
jgi:hypothetical protein